MPDTPTTETQDQNFQAPQELSQEQAQAIWDEEAKKREPGYTPPSDDTQAETQDDASKSPSEDETGKQPAADPAKKDDKSAKAKKDPANPAADAAQDDPVAKRFAVLEADLRRANGRIAAMQSEQARAAAEATKQVAKAPTVAEQAEALKSPETWKALKSEFPEWGQAIGELVAANQAPAGVSAADVATKVAEGVEAELAKRESAKIERKHKGWNDTVQSAEFRTWRESQDEAVNALGASPFAEDAIEMLDLFAKRNDKPVATVKTERKNRLAAATETPRVGRSTPTPKDDSELSTAEIWNQEAARRAERKKAQA